MISMFQLAKNHKPVAKAVHEFDESSNAKWVPVNKSFITLSKIILRAAAERLDLANIAITLRCITHQGYRHLVLADDEQNLHITAFGEVEEFIISTDVSVHLPSDYLHSAKSVSVSMNYQKQRLGFMVATLKEESEFVAHHTSNLSANYEKQLTLELDFVAREIVAIIKRYQTRYRAIFIYGDQSYWIGNGETLRNLDQHIDQLTHSVHPILLRGNKGSGKGIAARTLHCLRHDSILPYIESSCNEWQDGAATSILQALYAYAKGGTLFLRNVDKLSVANYNALQHFWSSRASELAERGKSESVGVILSVSKMDYVGVTALSLWLRMNTIELRLPDLRERRDDIRDLARFFMHEYALSIEFDFTEEAWVMLENYSWKENVEQLKRVIKDVALRTDDVVVTAEMLAPLLK